MMETENTSGNSFMQNSSSRTTFGHSESKPVRHGSNSKVNFEAFSMSQKKINDEDVRLMYVDDPDKTNKRFEFSGNSIRTGK